MVNDFGTVVRQMYEENLRVVKEDMPDVDDETLRKMACDFTEDDVALRAKELMEIWEDAR